MAQGDEVHEIMLRKVIIFIDSVIVAIFRKLNIHYYIEIAVGSSLIDPYDIK